MKTLGFNGGFLLGWFLAVLGVKAIGVGVDGATTIGLLIACFVIIFAYLESRLEDEE